MTSPRPRVAVIGAGPVGLEATRRLSARGFDVLCYEAGDGPGAALARFAHVQLFTPWKMNVSPEAWDDLRAHGLAPEVDLEAAPGIRDYVDLYLAAVARLPKVAPTLRFRHRLLAAGRSTALRIDLPKMPQRAESPFRLLLQDDRGREKVAHADLLVDASGITDRPAWVGRGGIPAPGEASLRASDRLRTRLPDLLGAERERFAGRRVLLVGSGYSAATCAVDLAKLRRDVPETRVVWIVRHPDGPPIAPIPGDSLPARAGLTSLANAAAQELGLRLGVWVDRLEETRDGCIDVTFSEGRREIFDEVLAMVGFLPDIRPLEGLQIELDYATRGPAKLARFLRKEDEHLARRARLAVHASPTWLDSRPVGPEVLLHPEPDLFVLGHKSFGSRPDFFLGAGWLQCRLLDDLLAWRAPAPT